MKRFVSIRFVVDANEYEATEDTPQGVLELVTAMFRSEADFPDEVEVQCEDVCEKVQT